MGGSLPRTGAWIETRVLPSPMASRAGRSLARERGLKPASHLYKAINAGRSLARERGLKLAVDEVDVNRHRRSLARERGLKLPEDVMVIYPAACRSLARERGLKHWRLLLSAARSGSLPRTGAWIETRGMPGMARAGRRRSLARERGLKLFREQVALICVESLPRTGAWIETSSYGRTGPPAIVAPSHGSVD